MLKIIGAIIIISVGIFFSSKLCKEQTSKLSVASSLIDFTEHIRASIYTSRLPLDEIFSTFTAPALADCGFEYQLNQNGLNAALCTVSPTVSPRSMAVLENLASGLGGINTDIQLRLCEETVTVLREEYSKQKEFFSEKKKMYRALPILLAASVVILML